MLPVVNLPLQLLGLLLRHIALVLHPVPLHPLCMLSLHRQLQLPLPQLQLVLGLLGCRLCSQQPLLQLCAQSVCLLHHLCRKMHVLSFQLVFQVIDCVVAVAQLGFVLCA